MTTVSPQAPTPKQLRLVRMVEKLSAARGCPPTLRELGAAMGCHWTGVGHMARRCQRAGLLTYDPYVPRSWRVAHPEART